MSVGSKKKLTIQVSEENRQFYCETRNEHGAENSSVIELDIQCEKNGKYWQIHTQCVLYHQAN